MECKKVLVVCVNDFEKVVEYLWKKGFVLVEKKVIWVVVEGVIGSYIYDGCIGVFIEVNLEMDFVV